MAVLSAAVAVAVDASVARSFIRSMMLDTSDSAPSAVCNRLIPFCAFFIATVMPRLCASRRVAICRPAASSCDELMR
ncbi:hypothetical protein D3C78_1483490 [compost metagenome]